MLFDLLTAREGSGDMIGKTPRVMIEQDADVSRDALSANLLAWHSVCECWVVSEAGVLRSALLWQSWSRMRMAFESTPLLALASCNLTHGLHPMLLRKPRAYNIEPALGAICDPPD